MNPVALVHDYLAVGALLFGIGLIGLISRRNLIVMFLSVEIMLQGVSLSLVAWSRFHGDEGGQVFILFIIAVAACEAAVALALILMLSCQAGNLDVAGWRRLREEGIEPPVDPGPETLPPPAPDWIPLTPVGRAPDVPPEETDYRPYV
ncbi:MAG: NADH-quinone oxidoreductase subunit NuoK [Pirellulales bacterium]|nr:NADH-quinone oxidoreductase subunit NuoK [Pirellulales bacterium]